jgi:hypothetical protein
LGEIREFELYTPATGATLRQHVQHALSLGLPDLAQRVPRNERLTILANGPSALKAPLHGQTLALNGAMGLFHNSGRVPTYWAGCDPQAHLADLLLDVPPQDTVYLVASKCHPAVFEKLKGRQVLLWHLDEEAYFDLVQYRNPVWLACTITLCALELAERLGFGGSDVWGWDGCYLDGKNHAVAQSHNADHNCDVEIGARTFRTTHNWLFEALSASDRFEAVPRDVTLHGGGMIDHLLRFRGVNPRLEGIAA